MESIVAWLDGQLAKWQLEPYLTKVGLTTHRLAQGIVFFGLGFIIGFIFKRQFKFIIGWLIVTGALYWLLDYNHLITIDWAGVRSFLGVTVQQPEVNTVVRMVWDWAISNVFVVICASIGLFLGYNVG